MTHLTFDVHGLVTIGVDDDAPTADQLAIMLAPFRRDGISDPDLVVTGTPLLTDGGVVGDLEFLYDEDWVHVEHTGVQIVRTARGWRVHGRRELLTTVLPLVDRIAVTRDAAMIHAATVEVDGRGVALPAWGGVGKTSTVAKLLRRGAAFLGDDWAFLTADQRLLAYHKPMFIKPHHHPIYPHLFEARHKPLVPSKLSDPVARLTNVVHPIATRYPRIAALSRRWSPEHMMVTPAVAFPGGRMGTEAPLELAVFVERCHRSEVTLSEVDRAWMVARMAGNFHAEMAPQSREVYTALAATSLLSLESAFGEKATVLDKALVGIPTFRLLVPAAMSADQASDVIVDHVIDLLDGRRG